MSFNITQLDAWLSFSFKMASSWVSYCAVTNGHTFGDFEQCKCITYSSRYLIFWTSESKIGATGVKYKSLRAVSFHVFRAESVHLPFLVLRHLHSLDCVPLFHHQNHKISSNLSVLSLSMVTLLSLICSPPSFLWELWWLHWAHGNNPR